MEIETFKLESELQEILQTNQKNCHEEISSS